MNKNIIFLSWLKKLYSFRKNNTLADTKGKQWIKFIVEILFSANINTILLPHFPDLTYFSIILCISLKNIFKKHKKIYKKLFVLHISRNKRFKNLILCSLIILFSPVIKINTVGIQIPNIRIPETWKLDTLLSEHKWFDFWMVWL